MKIIKSTSAKLGFMGLLGVVISSMMGSGVFSLPQNMSVGAGVKAVIAAWIVTGIGMLFVAETFRLLSTVKPQMTSGIYSYARAGFGKKSGFFIAWGYWLSNVFSNTAMAVIVMEALNYFFPPYFQGGNNINSFLVATVVIWSFFLLITRGIKTAALVNLVGTVGKLMPLVVFILVCIIAFKADIFTAAFMEGFSEGTFTFKGMMSEVKNTMIITLWVFIGIESAVVLSNRAENQKDIAKATLTGFISCLIFYMLISLLPFGILPREQLATFQNPSTAGVLEYVLGPIGGKLMAIGLIVSVLFAWLSWIVISIEVPFAAAKDGTFPKKFAQENKKGTPVFSLVLTTICMQLALLIAFFSSNAWNTMLNITAVMILPPYLFSTLYLIKLSAKKHYPSEYKISRLRLGLTGIFGAVYSLWLIYAANIKFLLMAVIFFSIGVPVLIMARKEKKKAITQPEQN